MLYLIKWKEIPAFHRYRRYSFRTYARSLDDNLDECVAVTSSWNDQYGQTTATFYVV